MQQSIYWSSSSLSSSSVYPSQPASYHTLTMWNWIIRTRDLESTKALESHRDHSTDDTGHTWRASRVHRDDKVPHIRCFSVKVMLSLVDMHGSVMCPRKTAFNVQERIHTLQSIHSNRREGIRPQTTAPITLLVSGHSTVYSRHVLDGHVFNTSAPDTYVIITRILQMAILKHVWGLSHRRVFSHYQPGSSWTPDYLWRCWYTLAPLRWLKKMLDGHAHAGHSHPMPRRPHHNLLSFLLNFSSHNSIWHSDVLNDYIVHDAAAGVSSHHPRPKACNRLHWDSQEAQLPQEYCLHWINARPTSAVIVDIHEREHEVTRMLLREGWW